MAGEGDLRGRRIDPDSGVPALLRLVDKDRFAQVHFPREGLKAFLRNLPRVREDSERVALKRGVGEDVYEDVAVGGSHVSTLLI